MFFNKKRPFQRVDYILILITMLLVAYGLVILKSATNSYESQMVYVRGQFFATLLGVITMILLMFTPPVVYKKMDFIIYAISIGLLVYTLLKGESQYISKSWVTIAGYTFQPSEFVKVGLIMSIASFMERFKERFNRLPVLLFLIALSMLPVALVLMQPDNGTALVMIGMLAVMFFIGGIGYKYILSALAMLVVAVPVFWFRLPVRKKSYLRLFRTRTRFAWQRPTSIHG